jgi:hypothetical protein
MTNKAPPPLISFVTRDGLSFSSEGSLTPLPLKLGHDLVSDLEITNPGELAAAIKKFIDTNKIKPGNLVLILSDSIYFEHEYPKPEVPANKDLEEFADTVPFSAVSSKLIPSGNGYRQIVINRDFYEAILQSLEQSGFKVTGVIPAFVLGISGSEITAETFRSVYRKLEQALTFGSLLSSDKDNSFEKKEQVFLQKNKLPIVILTFVCVIAALATAYFTLSPIGKKPRAKSVPVAVPRTIAVTPSPTPPPQVVPATPSAQLLNSLTVRIVNASGVSGRAASLSALLKANGLKVIQTGNSSVKTLATTISASPYAATAAGEYVQQLISQLYPGVTLTADTQAKIDLLITLGSD